MNIGILSPMPDGSPLPDGVAARDRLSPIDGMAGQPIVKLADPVAGRFIDYFVQFHTDR